MLSCNGIAGFDFQTGTALLAATSTQTTYAANYGIGTLYMDGSHGSNSWAPATQLGALTGTTNNAVLSSPAYSMNTITLSPACLALIDSTANGHSIVFAISTTGCARLVACAAPQLRLTPPFVFSRRKSTNLTLSYSTQATSTGFNSQKWEVSTDLITFTTVVASFAPAASFATTSWSLTAAVNAAYLNAATLYVRLTVNGASSSNGNNRLDNLQFVGC